MNTVDVRARSTTRTYLSIGLMSAGLSLGLAAVLGLTTARPITCEDVVVEDQLVAGNLTHMDASALTDVQAFDAGPLSFFARADFKVQAETRKRLLRERMRVDPESAQSLLLPVAARERLLEVASNCVETAVTSTGTIEGRVMDGDTGSLIQYYLNDGETRRQVFGLPATVQSGAFVEVTGVEVDGEILAHAGSGSSSVKLLSAPSALQSVNQHRPLLVMMGNYANTSQQFPDLTTLGAITTNLNAYYAENSAGQFQWDVTTRDWVTVPTNSPASGNCDWDAMTNALIKANDATTDFTQFEGGDIVLLYQFPSNCHFSGLSNLFPQTITTDDGLVKVTLAFVRIPYQLQQADIEYVLNHELGHNITMGMHANWFHCPDGQALPTPQQPCTIVEYGDPYDIMGGVYGPTSIKFPTAQYAAERKTWMGWIDPTQVVTMNNGSAEQDVTLTPQEWSSSGIKLLRIQRSQYEYLTVEFRQPTMEDGVTLNSDGKMFLQRFPTVFQGALLGQAAGSGGVTLLVDATPTPTNDPADVTLPVGQSLTDPLSGATISVLSQDTNSLRIHVTTPIIDYIAPLPPFEVIDGQGSDIDETSDTETVSAHWSAVTDVGTGLDHYEASLITADGDIVGATSTGLNTSITFTNLHIPAGTTYYVLAQGVDQKGNSGGWTRSDGVTLAGVQPAPTALGTTGTHPFPPECVYAGSEFQEEIAAGPSRTTLIASWCESPDAATVREYVYGIGTSPGATDVLPYTSAGLSLHVVRTGLTLSPDQAYYVTVRSLSVSGVAGITRESAAYTIDSEHPEAPSAVNDGTGADQDVTAAINRWRANWVPVSDQSAVTYYYALGTTPGGFDVISPTSTPITLMSIDDILLPEGTYYTSVAVKDAAGNTSPWKTSNGMTINPDVDVQPPTVTISSPTADTTISGIVTLRATASDAQGVESVQFMVDDVRIGEAQIFSPYEQVWNTNEVQNGSHVLTAVAYDANHQAISSPVSVTIHNTVLLSTDKPSLAFYSPPENTVVTGTVTLQAICLGCKQGMVKVDGVAIEPRKSITSFLNVVWDTTKVVNATHLVQVYGYDIYGNEAVRSAYLVTVNTVPKDTSAPQQTTDLRTR